MGLTGLGGSGKERGCRGSASSLLLKKVKNPFRALKPQKQGSCQEKGKTVSEHHPWNLIFRTWGVRGGDLL